jgi:hypothetical protein
MQKKLLLKQLIYQLLILLCSITAINIAIKYKAKNSPPKQVLRQFPLSKETTDIFVGHSLVHGGFSVPVFEANWQGHRAVNIGLESTWEPEHYLFLNAALRERKSPITVFYGFFNNHLTSSIHCNAEGTWSDISGNRALVYYSDLEEGIACYAPNDPIKAWQMRATAQLPALVERSSLWGQVEKMRRKAESVGMPPQETNVFGRAKDFNLLTAQTPEQFKQLCREDVAQNTPFNVPIEKIIRLTKAHNGRLIFVEMPVSSSHRTKFYDTPEWRQYREHVQQLAAAQGITYINASDWMDDYYFIDGIHLDHKEGGAAFTQELVKKLQTFPTKKY